MTQTDTREIPLSKGLTALVDAADYDALSKYKWHAKTSAPDYHYASRTVYVGRDATGRKLERLYLMHRIIAGAAKGQIVDHRNRNTLDNRRENLRLTDNAGNMRNRRKQTTARKQPPVSQFKGVSINVSGQYQARIRDATGWQHGLGTYPTEEQAARAYDYAATHWHGDYRLTNYPTPSRSNTGETWQANEVKIGAKLYAHWTANPSPTLTVQAHAARS